ncbi:MAG: hypothetical protein LLF98_06165 [Clostridium sp.]|uniref:hypothetical protein n=1 Tax=Clostridium sp. TaxID=1506 RepID=UPI0025C377F9|nr:hypothetical protein [Clostridium sp.]MCE5220852.1 hypothetical protein [Clostridium sp.]
MKITGDQYYNEAEFVNNMSDETTKAILQTAVTAQSQAEMVEKLSEIAQEFKI